jgi:hypothetical protein
VSVKVSTKVSEFDTYTYIYRNESIDIHSLLKKGVSFSFGFGPKKQVLPQAEKAPPVAAAPPAAQPPAPARLDPFLLKRDSEACNIPFTIWWEAYGFNGPESQSTPRRLWALLSDDERTTALQHTIEYVKVTNKRWRKTPINYLDLKIFNEEIIDRSGNSTDSKPKPGRNAPVSGQREIIRTEYVQQKFPRSGTAKPDGSRKSDAA